ncbi:MAG: ATP-binding protein [Gammaproteobacteria bacterium]|nr:ATP-binding protein [Gammaproteobacteria bacterium]
MREIEIMEILLGGENSKNEFKHSDVPPKQLAKEIVSFANMNGGKIILGVEDSGTISGIQRPDLQAWLMDTVIGRYFTPQIIPDYEEVSTKDGKVAIIDVPVGAAKPYTVKRDDRLDITSG